MRDYIIIYSSSFFRIYNILSSSFFRICNFILICSRGVFRILRVLGFGFIKIITKNTEAKAVGRTNATANPNISKIAEAAKFIMAIAIARKINIPTYWTTPILEINS